MTKEARKKLREAAIVAVNATRARKDQRRAALAGTWEIQTSNSFRRIGAHGDGDVLCATLQPSDGQPDLSAPPGVLDYIIAAQPSVILGLLDDLAALEGMAAGSAKAIANGWRKIAPRTKRASPKKRNK